MIWQQGIEMIMHVQCWHVLLTVLKVYNMCPNSILLDNVEGKTKYEWQTKMQNAGVNLKMEIGSTWHFHFPAECCSVWFIVMNVWCAKDGDE